MTATVVLIVSIGLQLLAALLALRLIGATGGRSAWAFIAGAIGLMAVRRIVILVEVLLTEGPELSLRAELVALAISALMVLGLASIRPLFDRVRRATELEAGFGQVLENSLSEFYIFALEDLRFLRVNLGAQENLGYSAEALAEMTPLDLKRDFTEAAFRELLAPLVAEDVPRVRFKTAHTRKDGSKYPVEVDLQRTSFRGVPAAVATILDTTERDAAERALRDSEAHFRSLIEHSQDIATVIDWDGAIVYASPSLRRILGHDPETRIGKRALGFVHPDDAERMKAAFLKARAQPEAHRLLVYRVRHADGSWHTMEGVGSVRQLPDGQQQFVINQRDISKRALAQRQKAEAEARLQRVQRMETLWTLAGGLAHDFNNLLTPIIGNTSLLEGELADRPAAREDAGEILRAAERAQALVQQLLTFSRQREKELETLELQGVVKEALQLARALLPTSIEMEINLDVPGEAVRADSTQIHQVIMNLCSNAEQAMREGGGTLRVSLGKVDSLPPEALDYGADSRPPFLHLSVGDSGPGMDGETVKRIFDPFFTTKRVGEGTGLGLAIVQGVVLDHGGAIAVDTAPGRGATFNVYLPALGVPAERPAEVVEGVAGGTERILVVDDEASVARVVQRLLEVRGYCCTVANGPDAALELLGAEAVDLVITDQTMPSMTGLELAERIRRAHAELPVILATGFSHTVTAARLAEAGVAATLTKPFAASELARCVREALDSEVRAGRPESG